MLRLGAFGDRDADKRLAHSPALDGCDRHANDGSRERVESSSTRLAWSRGHLIARSASSAPASPFYSRCRMAGLMYVPLVH